MNQHLQSILNIIQQDENLTAEQKNAISKSLKDADKELEITTFKLDRTEKVKRTTAILLEETIEELEQKRKAVEAQNRNLEIEAALERVRATALSMKKPEELLNVCEILLLEFKKLEFRDIRNTQIDIHNDAKKTFLNYECDAESRHKTITEVKYDGHPLVQSYMHEIRKADDAFFAISLKGEELDNWKIYRETARHPEDPKLDQADSLHYYFYSIGVGSLCISTYSQLDELSINILKRFRNVFDLAYRRFIDIQKAEAHAREAQIEASLERVRSKAMAMQKSEDLANAVAIVFEELDKLNLGMLRCGIGILNKEKRSADVWTTTKSDNDTVVQVSGDESMDIHPLLQGAFDAWLNQTDHSYVLEGKDLNDYYKALTGVNFKLPDSQSLITGTEGIHQYYFNAVFSSGGLFAFRETEFPEEAKIVLKRFADVFNLTYTRFNDLKQAEALARQAEQDLIMLKEEKKRTEEALAELKATQKQLIQSEKMASLGELTAGIAHEIQNPLNFVNNFSEVNSELIVEMKQEIKKGNMEEVKLIADDVEENEQKIVHHGKRADAIVKGMLQHSRTSSGQKDPTDINALADEYLRLSYHGLRAKEKSFNATIQTDFDNKIGKIDVIPQDIGRVLLNLYNNAFYAVAEKKKASERPNGGAEYEPTVSVGTKRNGDKVELRIKDNGNGIPQKVLDKIFQPFFTTKPTGQGTGLGLSLSYDIIKAHEGEIKVETTEGEGSEFIIHGSVK